MYTLCSNIIAIDQVTAWHSDKAVSASIFSSLIAFETRLFVIIKPHVSRLSFALLHSIQHSLHVYIYIISNIMYLFSLTLIYRYLEGMAQHVQLRIEQHI